MLKTSLEQFGRAMRQGRAIWLALVLGGFAVAGVMSCARERGLSPPALATALHLVLAGEPVTVVSINTDDDSVFNTLILPESWDHALVAADIATPRVLLSYNYDVRFYSDIDDVAPVTFVSPTARLAFTREPDVVIGSNGSEGGVTEGQLNIFRPPGFSISHVDSIGMLEYWVAPESNIIAGITGYDNLGGPPFSYRVHVYDYVEQQTIRLRELTSSSGASLMLWRCGVSPGGDRVYLGASHPEGIELVCYSPGLDSVLFSVPVNVPYGDPRVTPNGREVWYPDMGLPALQQLEAVRVFDSQTGHKLADIDLSPFRFSPNRRVIPLQIRFTPDGEKAYVLSQDYGGPLIVIDTQSRDVIDVIVTDTTKLLFQMDAGGVVK